MSATAPAAGRADTGAVFRATPDGARWIAAGALTFDNAVAAHAAAQALPLPASGVVACEGITAADSAAVAILLAVKRRAAAEGRAIVFADPPAELATLAALYGVEAILEG